ncbi:MAG TPA: NAD(P)H-hydrate epimerase, partial [Deltaproteobacteria bacterium]|nr:NAD(P)H-hydrate epimerase [Deltaproteobacteria bacterium]
MTRRAWFAIGGSGSRGFEGGFAMGRTGTTTRKRDDVAASIREGVWPLVTAREMQALDRRTIEEQGVAGGILMESAGRSLVGPVLALRRQGARPDAPVRAICGAGNNGGDGFVAIRHLIAEGVDAQAILVGDPECLPPDAASNWHRLAAIGAPGRVIDPSDAEFDGMALLGETSVAIDALFGTGLQRPIEGGHARWIGWLGRAREEGLRVLSVDIPSGISADTGQVLGVAVEADRTVTISLPKIGLALEPGRSHAGRIEVARIGIADPPCDRVDGVELWNAKAAAKRFPERPRA